MNQEVSIQQFKSDQCSSVKNFRIHAEPCVSWISSSAGMARLFSGWCIRLRRKIVISDDKVLCIGNAVQISLDGLVVDDICSSEPISDVEVSPSHPVVMIPQVSWKLVVGVSVVLNVFDSLFKSHLGVNGNISLICPKEFLIKVVVIQPQRQVSYSFSAIGCEPRKWISIESWPNF